MTPKDTKRFQAMLTALAEYFPNSRPNLEVIVEGYYEDLAMLPLEQVGDAFWQARRECQFFPTIKELREFAGLTRATYGHPGPEEAWAIYPKSEAETAIVTDEIMVAGAVAANMLDHDDLIAARMVFLEVYRKQLDNARVEQRPARWWATMGTDPQRRVAPLVKGVEQGKIAASRALSLAGGQFDAVATELALLPGSAPLGIAAPLSTEEARAFLQGINEALEAQGVAPLT